VACGPTWAPRVGWLAALRTTTVGGRCDDRTVVADRGGVGLRLGPPPQTIAKVTFASTQWKRPLWAQVLLHVKQTRSCPRCAMPEVWGLCHERSESEVCRARCVSCSRCFVLEVCHARDVPCSRCVVFMVFRAGGVSCSRCVVLEMCLLEVSGRRTPPVAVGGLLRSLSFQGSLRWHSCQGSLRSRSARCARTRLAALALGSLRSHSARCARTRLAALALGSLRSHLAACAWAAMGVSANRSAGERPGIWVRAPGRLRVWVRAGVCVHGQRCARPGARVRVRPGVRGVDSTRVGKNSCAGPGWASGKSRAAVV